MVNRTKDIRPIKKALRNKFKSIRAEMPKEVKFGKDSAIFNKIISLQKFRQAGILLTYVSTTIEVDTHRLIKYAFDQGKQVAVPRCVPGTRHMEFCLINSFDDLEKGTFSVLEPKKSCRIINFFPNSFCIVPGLGYDINGFRLGYGGGYYDRFLSNYKGTMAGICYVSCLHSNLPHGRFDCTVDLLITEKFCKRIKNKSKRLESVNGKRKQKR